MPTTANAAKRVRRSLTGVLLLDKPVGLSSNAALTRAKILYNADKAGHTGTLDPFASGLLPVCFGEATKFAGYLLAADKAYEATVRLGKTTATGDREGAVLTESPVETSRAAVIRVLDQFKGPTSQYPPMFSALKFQGRPLYELARQGVEIPRQARKITIHRLDLVEFQPPLLKLLVVCSKGTYVRVLAEDIGKALGCGGMLEELRRTRTGGFDIADSLTLERLGELAPESRDAHLAGPDRLVGDLPEITLDELAGRALMQGRASPVAAELAMGTYRAYSHAREFYGLVAAAAGCLKAKRMMSAPWPAPQTESHDIA